MKNLKSNLNSLEKVICDLAKNYRAQWKKELWESVRIEEYGLNEFVGGKAEAYEDCLMMIKKLINQTSFVNLTPPQQTPR